MGAQTPSPYIPSGCTSERNPEMVELLADAAPYSALLTLTVAPQTVRNTLKPTSTWLCRLFRVCF